MEKIKFLCSFVNTVAWISYQHHTPPKLQAQIPKDTVMKFSEKEDLLESNKTSTTPPCLCLLSLCTSPSPLSPMPPSPCSLRTIESVFSSLSQKQEKQRKKNNNTESLFRVSLFGGCTVFSPGKNAYIAEDIWLDNNLCYPDPQVTVRSSSSFSWSGMGTNCGWCIVSEDRNTSG